MKEKTIDTRCFSCAFSNPEGSRYCGMCGARLRQARHDAENLKRDYQRNVAGGSLNEALDFGKQAWERNAVLSIGISILVIVAATILLVMTAAGSDPFRKILLLAACFASAAFVLALVSRMILGTLRGAPPRFSEDVIFAWQRLVPAMLMLVWPVAGAILLSGLALLWTVPQNAVDELAEAGQVGEVAQTLAGLWTAVVFFGIVTPLWLIILAGAAVGMYRVVDGGANAWGALAWTFRKVASQPWGLLRMAAVQLFVQLIAFSFFFVPVLYTGPWMGYSAAAAYEWLRLHGKEAEEY